MSLDFYITEKLKNVDTDEVINHSVFEANITHNLTEMADVAGIYKHLWHPDEIGIERASELIDPLQKGLQELELNPEMYKEYDSPNGWGLYEHFVPFVRKILKACEEFPHGYVGTCT